MPTQGRARDDEAGIEFRKRLQDEAPLVQPGMRDLEGVLVDRLIAVEQQVEIDRARSVAGALAPDAAEVALDLQQEVSSSRGDRVVARLAAALRKRG
jgi:hypothetical protein